MSSTFKTEACQQCHQQIVWARTVRGQWMAVDPFPSVKGTVALTAPPPSKGAVADPPTAVPTDGGQLALDPLHMLHACRAKR